MSSATEPPRFSDEEAALILRRAASLDAPRPPAGAGAGFTLAELMGIAAEAGIDARHVAAAAAHLPVPDRWGGVLGAPTRYATAIELPGELPEGAWAGVVEEVRGAVRTAGRTVLVPGALDWRSNDQPEPPVHVRVVSGDGRTHVEIRADLRGIAFASVLLPAFWGGFAGAFVGDAALGLAGPAFAASLLVGVAAGGAAGAAVWRAASARWRRRLDGLVARIAGSTGVR
jgi:hypothetical protein